MLAAFLTTILFSISGVTAMRTTRYLPALEANFWRLVLATALLASYAHTVGAGLGGAAFGWFALSGFVGFGIGDIALYQAYPRLGSRLVVLIVHCVAAPLAAAVEWLWLGVPMTGLEMLAGGLILGGVATALFPERNRQLSPGNPGRGVGIGFALVAAAGQGIGAVLSRHAFEISSRSGEHVDGISAAYQRIWAGLLLSGLMLGWRRAPGWLNIVRRTADVGVNPPGLPGDSNPIRSGLRLAAPWLLVNAFAGPGLGVSCFQWALAERGTGVVLPIVALTPLVIVPFAMWMEGEKPTRRSLGGGLLAVAGAVIHAINHAASRP